MSRQYLDKIGTQKIVQELKNKIIAVDNKIPNDVIGASQVLVKGNTTSFTPTNTHDPVTKKYVDDIVGDINNLIDEVNGEVI